MNIAVIGWGSLIWCPGSLRIKTRWRAGGPMLPIEFARISEDGRLTLVIDSNSAPQQTYWALSALDELECARRNLKDREGCSLGRVRFFPDVNAGGTIMAAVVNELKAWLAKHEDIETVIWTGLETNWAEKFQREFSPDDAVRYLEGLETEQRQARLRYDRAKEYVRNAPASIQTAVRAKMRERGWDDAKLSDILFEPDNQR
ncbi:MAG TPA: hypothetical protein VFW94_16605 [Candidatus Acidoferrales bacterium]|nr:hypothetical protein [Candidatus Acidoferrales bacterium]